MGVASTALGVLLGGLLILGVIAGVGWYFVFGPGDLPFTPFFSIGDTDDEYAPDSVLDGITSTDYQYAPRTLHDAICYLLSKDIPFADHSTYISSLHMKMYGVSGTTAAELQAAYAQKYTAEGYTMYATNSGSGALWSATGSVWTKGNDARHVIIGEGAAMRANYGNDVVVSTGYGITTEYISYVMFLSRY